MQEMKRTRAEINRENAKKSTGPRSPEGKSRSSRNATTHGLSSGAPVLSHEHAGTFETIKNNILEDLRPETGREYDLAIEIAGAFWQRRRAHRIHTAFLNQRSLDIAGETSGELEGDYALAQLFMDPTDMQRMRLALRYVSAAERTYKALVSEFRSIRAERIERETGESDELSELTQLPATPGTCEATGPQVTEAEAENPGEPTALAGAATPVHRPAQPTHFTAPGTRRADHSGFVSQHTATRAA